MNHIHEKNHHFVINNLSFQLNAQMKIGNNVKSIDFLLKEV